MVTRVRTAERVRGAPSAAAAPESDEQQVMTDAAVSTEVNGLYLSRWRGVKQGNSAPSRAASMQMVMAAISDVGGREWLSLAAAGR